MSLPEVLHRLWRMLGLYAERLLIAVGWQPRPSGTVSGAKALFIDIPSWRDAWLADFNIDRQRLDRMADGKLDLFAYQSLQVGSPVDWLRNPLNGQPTPLDFGKHIDYRNDRIVGDIKVLWELGRHQHLVPLAVAYAVEGRDDDVRLIARQIDGWIDQNPFGKGVHWCSSLEVSLRLISWAIVHGLLVLAGHRHGLFSVVRDADRLGVAIYQQAWFVRHYLSRYSSANNHLIGELTGLWVASQVFEMGPAGRRWRRFARAELECEARAQVNVDGVDKEQAIYYHLWVLEYLLVAWVIGERYESGFSEVFRQRLLAMAKFLGDVSLEKGDPPQIGDADDGFVTRFDAGWPANPYNDMQEAAAAIFEELAPSGKGRSEKSYWYGLIAGTPTFDRRITKPRYVRYYPIAYRQGGYVILGDDDVRIVFDAGPLGYPSIAAHGHADALSICLAVGDTWWLVDPGTYSYHSEKEWRDYFRGTSAHNTLTINGLNQSRIGGNFLWLDRAKSKLEAIGKNEDHVQWARGSHDGYSAQGIVHSRDLQYDGRARTLTIQDRLVSDSASGDGVATLHFHFAPDVTINRIADGWLATRSKSADQLILSVDPQLDWQLVTGQTNPIQGWFSPMIGRKLPAPVLIGDKVGLLPSRLGTQIQLVRNGISSHDRL